MWIYEKDPEGEDYMDFIFCDIYPIPSIPQNYKTLMGLMVVLDYFTEDYYFGLQFKNLDWVEGKEEETGIYEWDGYYISMERPIYIKEPSRPLTHEEKVILNEFTDKYWNEIVKAHRANCKMNCFFPQYGRFCCQKFRNHPIPLTHPDYTLLDERKDV